MAKASDNVFPKVFFSEVVPATPAAGTQVVYIDPADHKLKRKDSIGAVTTVEGSSSGGSGSGIIALTAYNPATITTLTTTSQTSVDVDATNLAVTFTAPANGKVLVRLTALIQQTASSSSTDFTLREGTTTIQDREVMASSAEEMISTVFIVTGLTSGSSHTYKWGWWTGSANTAKLFAGGVGGAATMEVCALP